MYTAHWVFVWYCTYYQGTPLQISVSLYSVLYIANYSSKLQEYVFCQFTLKFLFCLWMHWNAFLCTLSSVENCDDNCCCFVFLFCFCLLEWLGSIEGRDEQCCIIIIITGKVCTCMRYCKWSDWAWENASSFFVCWNDIKKLVPSICHVCSVRVCVCVYACAGMYNT